MTPATRRLVGAMALAAGFLAPGVSLWRLTEEGWQRRLTTADGRTGYGGLVRGERRVQGSGTTPLGTFGLPSTFGTRPADPRAKLVTDYPREYEWSIVTDFNVEQVRHRGSGIFLHVNGRGATAGCVSAPRRFIRALVHRLDPARVPVIGIGR